MDNWDKIDKRLDRIAGILREMEKTLIKQAYQLEEHMRRTEINETAIDKLFTSLVPIQVHVNRLDGIIRFVGFVSLLVGLGVGVFSLFSKFGVW